MAYVTVEYMVNMLVKIVRGDFGKTQYGDGNGGNGSNYSLGGKDGDYWCFDCCGVIKAVCGGWNGNGVVYPFQNGVWDGTQDSITDQSKHSMSTISQAPVGAALRMIGSHVGVYIGNDKAIECSCGDRDGNHGTSGHLGGVQVTTVSTRGWDCWDYVAFVDYSTAIDPPDVTSANGSTISGSEMSTSDWQKAFVAQAKSHLGEDYNAIGGCSSYVSRCLHEIGYCGSEVTYSDSKYFWALENWQGVLANSSYFKEVSGSPQEGDVMVDWGNHTAIYGDGGTYEAIPGNGGHGSQSGVVHQDGIVCSCLNNPTIYRMTKSGGTINSGAAWTGSPSGGTTDNTSGTDSTGKDVTYNYNLHQYTVQDSALHEYTVYKPNVSYITTTVTKSGDTIISDNSAGATTKKRSTSLLSTPTLVESPFVSLQVGDYLFGSYDKNIKGKQVSVQYPNFITGMSVTKINGAVNTYTINMTYRIQAGDNPNMIDEILSTVGYGTVYLSYGDWNMPSFIYKQESALITKVTTKVNFANYSIDYTINCTSNSVSIAGLTYNFPKRNAKPSTVIITLLRNASNYGIKEAFPGLYNSTDRFNTLISELINLNDAVVEIEAQELMNPVTYINYLVSCMVPAGSSTKTVANATYYMVVMDDVKGAYFTVKRLDCSGITPDSYDVYEVDVGYPDITNNSNVVLDFSLNNDNSWSLLYDYGQKTSMADVVYKIDSSGTLYTESSQNLFTKNKEYRSSSKQQAWWTNMTQFPVTATLKVKGLLRPQMLMSYIRVNSYFYGHKHVSSGLYVITKQVDEINGSGYKTTLSLTRIAGDNDTVSQKVTTQEIKLPVVTYVEDTRQQTISRLEDPDGMNWERTVTYSINGGGSNSDNGGTATTSNSSNTSGSWNGVVSVKNGATLSDSDRSKLLDVDNLYSWTASYMKGQGYKKEAGVGLLCYVYNEGRNLGFYTYENNWNLSDPLGQSGGSASCYPELCTSNSEWKDKYLTYSNAYKNQSTLPCLGLGLLSETNIWNVGGGDPYITNATDLIDSATSKGVCWFDPKFYISYSVDRWTQATGVDTGDWRDPTTFTGTAKEYAQRVLCSYGMPGWDYSTVETKHSDCTRYWSSDTITKMSEYWDNASELTDSGSDTTDQEIIEEAEEEEKKSTTPNANIQFPKSTSIVFVSKSTYTSKDKATALIKLNSIANNYSAVDLDNKIKDTFITKSFWSQELIDFTIGYLHQAGVKEIFETDKYAAFLYAMIVITWVKNNAKYGTTYLYAQARANNSLGSYESSSNFTSAKIKSAAQLTNNNIKAAMYAVTCCTNIIDLTCATTSNVSDPFYTCKKSDGTIIRFK